jgi:secretion/DNA translocation related TadE-like protein
VIGRRGPAPGTAARTTTGRRVPDGDGTTTRARAPDRGGATICLLAVGLVYVLVGLFGAALGAARVARQQARVAADFGALAGAGRALDGAAACRRAGEVAGANGGRLVACRLDGLEILVTAEVTVAPLPWLTRTATATSRAGPVRG